ncbi:hypothetical protein M0R72_10085 [Candidatus Pacearchaeota archaeon]|jgi:hypothetical protein|nr:hypothetical protein [Candidatus Pacearchaeota archaeon]
MSDGATVTPLQTSSGTGADIKTALLTLTAGNYTPTNAAMIRPQLHLTSLNGAAATITVKIRNVTDGLTVYQDSVPKDLAADTGATFLLPPFLSIANKAYGIQVQSTNTSDSAVAWTINWLDAGSMVGTDSAGVTTLLSRVPQVITLAQVGGTGAFYVVSLASVGTGDGQINASGGKVPATIAAGDDADAAAIKTTIGVAGAGLTAVGGIVLSVFQLSGKLLYVVEE